MPAEPVSQASQPTLGARMRRPLEGLQRRELSFPAASRGGRPDDSFPTL